eukprot:m.88884 g.88884  ORF g.88884 m.88884 type:complete len:88 (-) comp26244_c0_seq4:59-322(-)
MVFVNQYVECFVFPIVKRGNDQNQTRMAKERATKINNNNNNNNGNSRKTEPPQNLALADDSYEPIWASDDESEMLRNQNEMLKSERE